MARAEHEDSESDLALSSEAEALLSEFPDESQLQNLEAPVSRTDGVIGPQAVSEKTLMAPAALGLAAGLIPTAVPESAPVEAQGKPEFPAHPVGLDQERLEAVVEKAVRETVGLILEKMLPRLIEEVVSKELAKLIEELNAQD